MMIHPATVHFAMVLPVVATAVGITYLATKNEKLSKVSARTTLIAALAMIAAWYTGNQAGPQIFEYLSPAGKHELLEHKELGLYLAIAMGVIALIQIAGCRLKKKALEITAIALLAVTMLVTFAQGKDGGEIVYKYGQPFKAAMTQIYLNEAKVAANEAEECDEQVEAYEDAIDNIDSMSQEVNAIYGAKNTETDKDDE